MSSSHSGCTRVLTLRQHPFSSTLHHSGVNTLTDWRMQKNGPLKARQSPESPGCDGHDLAEARAHLHPGGHKGRQIEPARACARVSEPALDRMRITAQDTSADGCQEYLQIHSRRPLPNERRRRTRLGLASSIRASLMSCWATLAGMPDLGNLRYRAVPSTCDDPERGMQPRRCGNNLV